MRQLQRLLDFIILQGVLKSARAFPGQPAVDLCRPRTALFPLFSPTLLALMHQLQRFANFIILQGVPNSARVILRLKNKIPGTSLR